MIFLTLSSPLCYSVERSIYDLPLNKYPDGAPHLKNLRCVRSLPLKESPSFYICHRLIQEQHDSRSSPVKITPPYKWVCTGSFDFARTVAGSSVPVTVSTITSWRSARSLLFKPQGQRSVISRTHTRGNEQNILHQLTLMDRTSHSNTARLASPQQKLDASHV